LMQFVHQLMRMPPSEARELLKQERADVRRMLYERMFEMDPTHPLLKAYAEESTKRRATRAAAKKAETGLAIRPYERIYEGEFEEPTAEMIGVQGGRRIPSYKLRQTSADDLAAEEALLEEMLESGGVGQPHLLPSHRYRELPSHTPEEYEMNAGIWPAFIFEG